ncbi:MAG: hypothetical protein K0U70_08840, partial [Actinomycetia bacterium]|nr:hypothetical protein [Actinomycetes bacterium]
SGEPDTRACARDRLHAMRLPEPSFVASLSHHLDGLQRRIGMVPARNHRGSFAADQPDEFI